MLPFVSVFGLEIPVYGILSIIGIAVCAVVIIVLSKKKQFDLYDVLITAVVAGLGVFLGAHILYAVTRIEDIIFAFTLYDDFGNKWDFIKHLLDVSSGLVFYGGLYGGLLAGYLWIRHKKYPPGIFSDVFAVVIPLFHTFGRVGCFFAGCCYGVEWEYGLMGRVLSSGKHEYVTRFPVQLAEAFLLILLFVVLLLLYLKNTCKGRLMTVYLSVYAVIRFILEFLRGDEIRGHLWIFSTSQWISLLTLSGVILYLVIDSKKRRQTK